MSLDKTEDRQSWSHFRKRLHTNLNKHNLTLVLAEFVRKKAGLSLWYVTIENHKIKMTIQVPRMYLNLAVAGFPPYADNVCDEVAKWVVNKARNYI